MNDLKIIVIGASAGGVDALKTLFSTLPQNLSAAIFVVIHRPPRAPSLLAEILQRRASLRINDAVDGESIQQGRVYLAPPDRHIVIEQGHLHLSAGPKENRSRPAINPLFRSAALTYGSRLVGIILTGALDDGTLGLWEIKRRGGIAIVQEPDQAQHRQMPDSAIENVAVDYRVRLAQMGPLLVSLTAQEAKPQAAEQEPAMPSENTNLTCPECHGPLQLVRHGHLMEMKCRVGHSYSGQNALAAHSDSEERILWSAIEYLEEGADLADQLAGELPPDSRSGTQTAIAAKRNLANLIRSGFERSKTHESADEQLVRPTPHK